LLLKRADIVVGQSRNTLPNVERYYSENIIAERIPLGIPRPPKQYGSRQEFGFAPDEKLLITLGRLVPRKAVDQLVELTGRLRDRGQSVQLLVLGSGPSGDELRQQATDLGLADNIHFYGHVEESEKLRLLSISDIFLSTSQHEGFGLIFLEAMASGLPIICYDHGGQTDFLTDHETGFLVALNDLDAFQEGVERLLADPAQIYQMSETNFGRVEGYFIDHCAARYETVFKHVVQG
jgi:glycosyltransferase involved in cell wall biosynthesis